jgi:hypothetical protein
METRFILRLKAALVHHLFIALQHQRSFNHLCFIIVFTSSGSQVNSRRTLTPDEGWSQASWDMTLA